MSETILSKNNSHIKDLANLKKIDPSLFLVEGYHLVEMAYESKALVEVLALEDPHLDGVRTILTSRDIIEKLASSKNPEPIIGVCKKVGNKDVSSEKALLLDRVQDPGNVGTLLRTALAFGFKKVLSLEGSASFYNSKAIASSQGAIFKLELKEGLKEIEAVSLLKQEGYFLLGSALEGGAPFAEIDAPRKLCLVLGNEGQGMSESLKKECRALAYIPMSGIDSLNVGVAGGILMQYLNSKDAK